ncbi:MAG: type IV pilus biogenesis/stability protein PilW [Burkholderiaceae bacterium]|jgi:type IV pilus assembly protein PilF
MVAALPGLAGCSFGPKQPPEQPVIVSQNSSQGGFNPDPGTSFNSTSSQAVNIKDRSPDTDARKRARLHMELAIGYYQDGKFAVALDELKQALGVDPTFAEAHGVLALVYMELGEKQLAEQSFQKALQLAPDNSDILNNYGWFLCQNGRTTDSIPYFLKAIQNPLYPQPAKPLQNAGVCSMRAGDKTAAENYFQRSFQLDPSGPVSALNLAEIFYARGETQRARFYVSLVNKSASSASAESLWLGIRIEHQLGNGPEELSLSTQLERNFPGSREAELQARHAYNE